MQSPSLKQLKRLIMRFFMSEFKFVSHESYPEDKYIKEIVYIEVKGGFRFGYIHKIMQNGGSFWDVMGSGVTKNGEKSFAKAVKFADNFLQEDIKDYLTKRRWETSVREKPTSMDEVAQYEQLPF
jgi:hypothetical protein